jgi:predicted flap endonuclease-1-like 5' DNA nuclease
MPELTALHIALLVVAAIVGAVAAWVLRGQRAEQEKAAVSAGWQEQIEAQRREHERLVDQNKGLMDQVSQFRAQHADAKNRAKELSTVVQEAFTRRDELQREIKDIRGNLETALNERDQLASTVEARSDDGELLREKDERIARLSKELANWQERLPPLIERFRVRNEEAGHLEAELDEARERIRELESGRAETSANETRIEPVHHAEELTDGLDASNDADDHLENASEAPDTVVATEEVYDLDAVDEVDDPDAVDEVDDPDAVDQEFDAPPMPRDARDDLKMIKGVGPAIEKTLNELGIFSLQQIADMSEYDIDRVARRLKGFHSRIHREDWIGQARALLDEAAHA